MQDALVTLRLCILPEDPYSLEWRNSILILQCVRNSAVISGLTSLAHVRTVVSLLCGVLRSRSAVHSNQPVVSIPCDALVCVTRHRQHTGDQPATALHSSFVLAGCWVQVREEAELHNDIQVVLAGTSLLTPQDICRQLAVPF